MVMKVIEETKDEPAPLSKVISTVGLAVVEGSVDGGREVDDVSWELAELNPRSSNVLG